MQKYIGLDSGLYRTLSLVFDLIILNFWFVLTSLPIVTLGASISATYSVAIKLVNNEAVSIKGDYLEAFKRNFKKSTVVFLSNSLIMLVIGAVIIGVNLELAKLPLLVVVAVLLLLSEIVYPLITLYDGTLQEVYHLSIGITLQYLIYLVVSFILTLGFLAFPIYFIKLSFLWLMLGGGLLIYLKAKVINPLLIKLNLIQVEEN